ncbi:hypothetical protein EII31_03805 [Leucobacter sp. OH2974_COT-288]|nr:hypothetical protein EII31_03805 [Leucobacter sp. OH2974_COT-288]
MALTIAEKKKITRLRRAGIGYKSIGHILGIPEPKVKSFCQYHEVVKGEPAATVARFCKYCAEPLDVEFARPNQKFCTPEHQKQWWAENRNQRKTTADTPATKLCEHCGREFPTDGKTSRRYCSRDCYIQHRFYSKAAT